LASLFALALACLASGFAPAPGASAGSVPAAKATGASASKESKAGAARGRASKGYGRLPLRFEPNVGQAEPGVDFISRGHGYGLFIKGTEAVLALRRAGGGASRRTSVIRMKLSGATNAPEGVGVNELPGRVNYLRGSDPAAWRTGVASFSGVEYRGVYEGVDLVYYGNQRQLEYDFRLAPGADARRIRLAFEGQTSLRVDASGDLVLRAPGGGEVRQRKPYAYQEDGDGSRAEVASRYVLKGRGQVGFEVGAYDAARPLVIDPVLAYSTYLGGDSTDTGHGIEVDGEGNAYVVGYTASANFPVTKGAFQTTKAVGNDVFVTKMNPDGSDIVYSTFLAGATDDTATDVFVDATGHAYVTGATNSADFPTTEGAYQRTRTGTFAFDRNAFVAKLSPDGSSLVYSTLVGPTTSGAGANSASAENVAVNDAGEAYITGFTDSLSFPVTAGAPQAAYGGGKTDGFVTKLNAAGSALLYSTYLGGSTADVARGVAVHPSGEAYVAGTTNSPNFPVTSNNFPASRAFQNVNRGGNTDEAFVTRLDDAGTLLLYSTYLGGTGLDYGYAVAVDAEGSAYVTGYTQSANFPTTAGAFQTLPGACPTCSSADGFVTKLAPNGSSLVYSTLVGGATGLDLFTDIKLDRLNNASVVGQSNSTDYPVTPDAYRETRVHGYDVVVTRVNAAGDGLAYSTYVGDQGSDDTGWGIAVDADDNLYITGVVTHWWPSTPGAYRTGGFLNSEAFVTKLDMASGFGMTVAPPARTVAPGASTTYTVEVAPRGGFAREVGFSVSGLPAGVTASFNPATVDTSGTTEMTITAAPAAVEDTYALTVHGKVPGAAAAKCPVTLVVAASRAAPRYSVTDLGTLGGAWSRAEAVNNSGQVAGTSADAGRRARAFVYAGGAMKDLGTLEGHTGSYAGGINDAGDVVGYSAPPDAHGERPFVYRAATGQLQMLPRLEGAADTTHPADHAAYDIGGGGHVVGASMVDDGTGQRHHSFVHHEGATTDASLGFESYLMGVNKYGDAAGYFRNGSGSYQAMVFSGNILIDNLAPLPGGSNSYAWDINDAGLTVGASEYSRDSAHTHAVAYTYGVATDLGTLGGIRSDARAVNNAGYVVGLSANANGRDTGSYLSSRDDRAFVHHKGTMVNLNTLIDAASGWVLVEARDISDAGHIVGWGIKDGAQRAFLLTPLFTEPTPTPTPVPTPVTYTIAGRVTLPGGPVSGVTVTLSGARTLSVTTDADGNYAFPGLGAGRDYAVTPSKTGYKFQPASASFSALGANQTANFAAAAPQLTNYALASNGGVATASSTTTQQELPGLDFSPSGAINGDRRGLNWERGGGWRDATNNAFPDWLQVDFSGAKSISEVGVFMLQDNYTSPAEPTEAMTFSKFGATAFDVQYWDGAQWAQVPGASVVGNDKVWRRLTFTPLTTTKMRVLVRNALAGRSRLVEVEAWGAPEQVTPPPAGARINAALASNGGHAVASTTTTQAELPGMDFSPAGVINGDRKGLNWEHGGGWRDATNNAFPDWLEVAFAAPTAVDEIGVFSLQDNYSSPAAPTEATAFTKYGVTSFVVQFWDGAQWAAVPGGTVTNNSSVWRKITFPAVTTTRVRVVVNAALAGRSRLVEVEAWGVQSAQTQPPATRVNHASASNGGAATASSTTPDAEYPGLTFPVSSVINGDWRGLNWERGGGWRDGTANAFPDWVEVSFAGSRKVDEVNVFSLQDNYASPAEPTEATAFTKYGVTALEVQHWDGAAWVTVPGGVVTDNGLVWRKVTFPEVTTTKVRVVIHNAAGGRSRLVEVEAVGPAS
jgi:probable HAF family extracellular repeat protein